MMKLAAPPSPDTGLDADAKQRLSEILASRNALALDLAEARTILPGLAAQARQLAALTQADPALEGERAEAQRRHDLMDVRVATLEEQDRQLAADELRTRAEVDGEESALERQAILGSARLVLHRAREARLAAEQAVCPEGMPSQIFLLNRVSALDPHIVALSAKKREIGRESPSRTAEDLALLSELAEEQTLLEHARKLAQGGLINTSSNAWFAHPVAS
ncbi:hypothetical protein TSH58p_04425 [Azospirillum sp. TSH58]|uniref:hypothetical protein n=1 Tax=Azospirillum sp. TSH58 TaxID=664962 RepID=UPI000D60101D|nr:hypothetical protein [Azospirillum sp. TSH58]AWJ82828.1 hypothetical protein TSH58p_04425 [Azospirillum sp. TSH58]PWC61275.1 hypothetical protein TSH58_27355 [Azospirillum sp. TSH58]